MLILKPWTHEVLIRVLALLQRKTLLETKIRTLKFLKRLKWHFSTVQSMKNVAVLMEDRAFVLFFRPHPGNLTAQELSPHPQEFAIQGKKNTYARGSACWGGGGAGPRWNWVMHNFHKFPSDRPIFYGSLQGLQNYV